MVLVGPVHPPVPAVALVVEAHALVVPEMRLAALEANALLALGHEVVVVVIVVQVGAAVAVVVIILVHVITRVL